MATREQLHRLVDKLPDEEIQAASRFLGYLLDLCPDPLLLTLARAPIDDESETEEERLAVEEARAALARGEVVSDEELRRELGL